MSARERENEKRMYQERVERCQDLMREVGADLLVLFPGPNLYYLSGFREEAGERPLLFCLPPEGGPFFIAPKLYAEHIRRDSWVRDLEIWSDAQDPWMVTRKTILERGLHPKKILIDDRSWAMFLLSLEKLLPEGEFALASRVLRPLRMRKSPEEIAALRKASAIVDEVFQRVIEQQIQGLTELQLAAGIEQEMRQLGGEGLAFETLVASGPNGSFPHHRAGRRVIQEGDVVILDYGCRVNGYHSDITRTIVCGQPDLKVRQIYEVVQRAQDEAVRSVKPGLPAEEVDRIARGQVAAAGFGEQFIHRTGHGIGLEVHEPPYLVEGNKVELAPGMVFSVEPGIYLPEEFGIRIEDIVLVTEDGAERLNQAGRDLIIVS